MPEDFWILSLEGICRPTYISYHRFPKNRAKLGLWLQAFQLSAEQLRSHSRVCSRHFRGDVKNVPDPTLLGRFASPIKKDAPKLSEDKRSKSIRKHDSDVFGKDKTHHPPPEDVHTCI